MNIRIEIPGRSLMWGFCSTTHGVLGFRVCFDDEPGDMIFEGPTVAAGGDVTEWIEVMANALIVMGLLPAERRRDLTDNGRAFYAERGYVTMGGNHHAHAN